VQSCQPTGYIVQVSYGVLEPEPVENLPQSASEMRVFLCMIIRKDFEPFPNDGGVIILDSSGQFEHETEKCYSVQLSQ
jgi:hypothetical protein